MTNFNFTIDSDTSPFNFVELGPNQTINFTTVGIVDSDTVLRLIDSEYILSISDSEFVQTVTLVEKQLEGYSVGDPVVTPGDTQQERISGTGTFNVVTAKDEIIVISLDSEWQSSEVGVSPGTIFDVVGNSGVNTLGININGRYFTQSSASRRLDFSSNNYRIVTESAEPWYYNSDSDISLVPAVAPQYKFLRGHWINDYSINEIVSSNIVNYNSAAFENDLVTAENPSLTTVSFVSNVGGGSSVPLDSDSFLTYTFTIPHLDSEIVVVFDSDDDASSAQTKISNAFSSISEYNVSTYDSDQSSIIEIDTNDSDIANMTIAVTNNSTSTNVLFDGSSSTNFSIQAGFAGAVNSVVTVGSETWVAPSGSVDSDFFEVFPSTEAIADRNFVRDSDLSITSTNLASGPTTPLLISVNHGIGAGTFAFDSDTATVVRIGTNDVVSVPLSYEFFRKIYDSEFVETFFDSEYINARVDHPDAIDSDEVLRLIDSDYINDKVITFAVIDSDATPTISDFAGAVFYGEYS